jgi:predicted AlkP superfamily pyrophosphatase or phosphodiesterase
MKRKVSGGPLVLLGLALTLSSKAHTAPTLVVQITADQLRGDLLDKYRNVLNHGFSRLESGAWYHHGSVDHAVTLSWPGHTTLATGLFPSHHGLTANEWWVRLPNGKWGETEVVQDEGETIFDTPARHGVSPRFLTATTLGEWIKAANPQARSVTLGTGEGISVAYAGHNADAVYWYAPSSNIFTTSSYYAPSIAPWVVDFNRRELSKYEKPVWSLSVTGGAIQLADPDNTATENHGKNNVFPHVYARESNSVTGLKRPYGAWFDNTPLKDEALFALVIRAITAERLGQRGVTDYLAIAIGSTDNVGHIFGPNSLEQLDTLARLDRVLGKFLNFLDHAVGRDKYVVVFSADHGVTSLGEPGVSQVSATQIETLLDKVETVAAKPHVDKASLRAAIVGTLKSADFIADAYTEERLQSPSNDPLIRLYRNSLRPGFTTDFPLWTERDRPHHPARYGIIVRFKENMIIDAATAVHGSPYDEDRLVPVIFFGRGIKPGEHIDEVRTVDVAPTLAAAASINTPPNLDGRVIRSALMHP